MNCSSGVFVWRMGGGGVPGDGRDCGRESIVRIIVVSPVVRLVVTSNLRFAVLHSL